MKRLLFSLFILVPLLSFQQRKSEQLFINGQVLGYHYEPSKFFKKEQVELQGGLSGVKIKVTSGGKEVASATTDAGGSFELYAPINKRLLVSYSKSGYSKSTIQINLGNVPEEMVQTGLILNNIELILNKNKTEYPIDNGKVFAYLNYSSSRVFSTEPVIFERRERLFKDIENSTPYNLLSRSVKKNKDLNREAIKAEEVVEDGGNKEVVHHKSNNSNNGTSEEVLDVTPSLEKKIAILKNQKFGNVDDWKDLSANDLESRANEINSAWEQLEKDKLSAVTEEDFIIIEAKEELLLSAERELDAAKAYIKEQEGKLNAQRNFIIVMVIMFLLLGAFVFYLIKSIRDKNRLNKELEEKNQRITSSINYAERIQKSVLLGEAEIKSIFPQSFVYYEPLAVVSGDFYWFSEVDGKAIVAAVDCTGHGVPGAFMSLIGNTLLNQIVNEKGVTNPAEILQQLHNGIVQSLKQEEDDDASQDGMDMSICSMDKKTGEVIFSGAVNPIFVVEDGEVKEVSGDLYGVGGVLSKRRKRKIKFTEQKFQFAKGTNIYLFSDGFMDQFSGSTKEKFNLPRFREMLLDMKDLSMEDQREKAKTTLQTWKGSANQIDDILLIGIQV